MRVTNKILIPLMLLASVAAFGQGLGIQIPNDTSAGTTLNKPVKLNLTAGAPSVVLATSVSDLQVIGICTSNCGTTGSATVQTFGVVKGCVFDNTVVAGDYVQVASGGGCHDAGSTRPTSGVILGTVFQAGGSAGTYSISLNKDIYPSSGATTGSIFGDGSDGAVTADGAATVNCLGAPSSNVYTMTRDCYFTTLVINSGVTIKTVSNRLLSTISIVNSGTISNAGTGAGAGGGATGTNHATGGTNGSNSSTLGSGSLPAPISAGAGRTGGSGGTGVGSSGTNGLLGGNGAFSIQSTASAAGAAGGNGGASGASGGNNAGGTGGTAGVAGASSLDNSLPHEFGRALIMRDAGGNGFNSMGDNGGGGSGGAGGGDGTNNGGGGGGSGGNGGNGGFIVIAAPTITLNVASVINVSGGAGGNGGAGGTPTTGNCGGGGGGAGGDGGNGGAIVRIYSTLTNNGTDTLTGGAGGTAGALGTGVGTGTSGTAGAAGNAGTVGLVFNLQLS
jgi:hypothetical protein